MTPREIAADLSDLDVLALTLHHEAGQERLIGLIAVASVIKNRAEWGKWGPSITDVCLAPWQFSCWVPQGGVENHARLKAHANVLRQGKRPKEMRRAFEVAEAVFEDGLPDPTRHADHYYAPLAMVPLGRVPEWAHDEEPSAVLGHHRFYKLRRA